MRRLSLFSLAVLIVMAAALPALAADPSAPVVTTGAAGGIGAKTATLNGTVNASGASTIYWFEYGTTTSYGLQTGTHGAGSGTSARPVSAHIFGLVAGTTYHFRLVAQNSAGTTDGQDQTFTTSAANAPQVTTAAASKIGAKTATLNGTVNPNGAPTKYWFQYGTTSSYGLQTGTSGAGSGHERTLGLGGDLRSCRRDDLSLPSGRAELGRHDRRARPDVHHERRICAAGDDGCCGRDRRQDRDLERDGQPERRRHELLVPVRNDDELRPADRHPRRRERHL